MKVYYQKDPKRSVVFVSNGQTLLLENSDENSSQFHIKFTSLDKFSSLDQYRQLSTEYKGILGMVRIESYVFIVVIEESVPIASPRPNETVYELRKVEFFCLNSPIFDHYDNIETHPCYKLSRLLSTGRFYYSRNFDLTNPLQQRGLGVNNYQQMYDKCDSKYVWNGAMIDELINFRQTMLVSEKQAFDEAEFATFLIRGFVKTINTTIDADVECLITIISKISNDVLKKDDDNYEIDNLLNVIETEFVLYHKNDVISYVQILGNLPMSFEIETNNLLATKKIISNMEYNEKLTERSLEGIILKYGNVVVLNYVKAKSTDEELMKKFDAILSNKGIINFDISKNLLIKSQNILADMLKNTIIEIGAFVYDIQKKVYIGNQLGIFRVNFVHYHHSLKYGNSIAELMNRLVLEKTILELKSFNLTDLLQSHELLWDENFVKLNDFHQRYYSKELHDISSLIQNPGIKLVDPIHDYLLKELSEKIDRFRHQKQISIFTGSFNVNGEVPRQDLSSWLFPDGDESKIHDIVAIGLQEVIELTTNKLIIVDDSKKKYWEYQILHCLNQRFHHYKKIMSTQLGGVVLMVFIKEDQFKYIKNVDKMVKKTGFGGISANKGAVAISITYSTTKICIISSHLSAGLENIEQRHNDYKSIFKKLQFGPGRSIKNHDATIWMGDFNYRITDLGNDKVRKAIARQDFNELLEHDQLIKQMVAGESFPYFHEMEITFPPTYKFDKGTSVYDTGEKKRVPAWTDRILFRGKLKQIKYDCVPDIMFSDHRPIYGVFDLEVGIIDELEKNKMMEDLLFNKLLNDYKGLEINDENRNKTSGELSTSITSHDEQNQQLPPPSSDTGNKWWINKTNGKIKIDNLVLPENFNPSIQPNPFV